MLIVALQEALLHVLLECSTSRAINKKAVFGARNMFATLMLAVVMMVMTAYIICKLVSSDSYSQYHFS